MPSKAEAKKRHREFYRRSANPEDAMQIRQAERNDPDPNTCLRRALAAALRFAGLQDDCSWVPANAGYEALEEICSRYDLEWLGKNGQQAATIGSRPVLVIYDMENAEDRRSSHAVFASDIHPCQKWTISHVLLGWEFLKK